jgi:hypothetical protein
MMVNYYLGNLNSEFETMINLEKIDYSRLDRPEILMFLFHPRPEGGFPGRRRRRGYAHRGGQGGSDRRPVSRGGKGRPYHTLFPRKR